MKKLIIITIIIFSYSCSQKNKQKVTHKEHNQIFTLQANQGDSISIKKNNKPKIFFSLDPECPLCQSYGKKVYNIYNTYNEQIDFYSFFPAHIFSETKIKQFIEKYNLNMTCILDTNQILTYFLDAKVTPECFLLDQDFNIIYQGLIDDWVKELGRKGQYVNNEYLINAIDSHLNNKLIKIKKTNAIGCIIERLP